MEYKYTKQGLISKLYGAQRYSSKKRGHPLPTYTNKELREWAFSKSNFHILYNQWKNSNFEKMLRPSLDRKNNDLGYSLDNIQFMTWAENKQKAHDDMRDGVLINGVNPQLQVDQFTKCGKYVATYVSQIEAERQTGISHAHISKVCRGIRKTAGGYKWRLK